MSCWYVPNVATCRRSECSVVVCRRSGWEGPGHRTGALAISKLGVPWWTYTAIDKIEDWLSARPRPIRVFEYGSGASTIWLAERADEVYSVEHHKGFAEYMAPALSPIPKVRLFLVEPAPDINPRTPSGKEGNENLDFSDYVAAIDQVKGGFDLVVVDGRARQACLARASARLAPDGIIVFDNSGRRRYRGAIEASGLVEERLRGLVPTLPYPDQTSILRRTPVRAATPTRVDEGS
jgi:hypothetical protein